MSNQIALSLEIGASSAVQICLVMMPILIGYSAVVRPNFLHFFFFTQNNTTSLPPSCVCVFLYLCVSVISRLTIKVSFSFFLSFFLFSLFLHKTKPDTPLEQQWFLYSGVSSVQRFCHHHECDHCQLSVHWGNCQLLQRGHLLLYLFLVCCWLLLCPKYLTSLLLSFFLCESFCGFKFGVNEKRKKICKWKIFHLPLSSICTDAYYYCSVQLIII